MPGRNGTGPLGAGAMTGRGLGGCAGATTENAQYPVFGIGCRRRAGRGSMRGCGFGRGSKGPYRAATPKEALERQREALRNRLDQIEGQLKNT